MELCAAMSPPREAYAKKKRDGGAQPYPRILYSCSTTAVLVYIPYDIAAHLRDLGKLTGWIRTIVVIKTEADRYRKGRIHPFDLRELDVLVVARADKRIIEIVVASSVPLKAVISLLTILGVVQRDTAATYRNIEKGGSRHQL